MANTDNISWGASADLYLKLLPSAKTQNPTTPWVIVSLLGTLVMGPFETRLAGTTSSITLHKNEGYFSNKVRKILQSRNFHSAKTADFGNLRNFHVLR